MGERKNTFVRPSIEHVKKHATINPITSKLHTLMASDGDSDGDGDGDGRGFVGVGIGGDGLLCHCAEATNPIVVVLVVGW
jgi:hypothetical protein